MNIKFNEKENSQANDTTRYWFEVDGADYCIADKNGDLSLLDCDGCPIEECNDHDGIKDALIPHYKIEAMVS